MHNRKRTVRLSAYMLSALMVVSCGNDSITLPGFSTDQLQLLTSSGVAQTVPLDGSLDVKFSIKDSTGAPLGGKSATVSVLSGKAGLLDVAGTLTSAVSSLSVTTAADGTGTFLVRGLELNSTGIIEVRYVDEKSNARVQTFTYVVGANANSVNTLDLTTASGVVSTSGSNSETTITALLKKKSTGELLAGRTVTFTKTNGFGQLSATTAVSGADGKATVIFSGNNANPGSGIVEASYTDSRGNVSSSSISLQIIKTYSMSLTSQTSTVPTGSNTAVTLSAFVLDSGGTAIKGSTSGLKVTFSNLSTVGGKPDGVLDQPSDISDTGLATVKYYPDGNNIVERQVTLRAALSGASLPSPIQQDVVLTIGGNAISLLSNQNNVLDGDVVQFNGKLVTGQGNPISGKTINLTPSGLTGVPATATTDTKGEFQISNVTVNTGGASVATLKSSVSGLASTPIEATSTLSVSQKNFRLESTLSDNIPIGTPQPVTVRMRDTSDVNGRVINLASTLGAVQDLAGNPIHAVTLVDATPGDTVFEGTATFQLVAGYPGTALLEAETTDSDSNLVKISKRITFISVTPSKLTIQAVSPNLSALQATNVTVRAFDTKDNPVKNVVISFNANDPSHGDLSAASLRTDANGQATIVFTAGSVTTAKDAVSVTATAPDFPAVAPMTQYMTVGGKALFLSIGTGNVIGTLPSAPTTTYSLPHQVVVTDANGAPIANSDVLLSIIPISYMKGRYVAGPTTWGAVVDGECLNEDANLNGILEPIENDGVGGVGNVMDNADGKLWPGNPVTLSAKTIRTDINGVASFDVIYAKSYSNWLRVKIVATTTVEGSETRADRSMILPGLTDDFKVTTLPPGGTISTYGTSNPASAADMCSYVYYPPF